MTCSEISELLPWLANDRLGPEERERVEEHLKRCGPCSAELADVILTLRAADQHIPAADLVALVDREAGSEYEQQALTDHLAHCRSCRAELDLVRASYRSLEVEGSAPPVVGARWPPLALAASFLLGLVALGGWWWTASTPRPERVDKPNEAWGILADIEIVEVLPDDLVLRGPSENGATIVPGSSSRPAVLLLLTNDATRYEDHRVELRGADQELLWMAEGVQRQSGGGFAILVAPGFLGTQPVFLSLFGKQEGRWIAIETYALRGPEP